MPDAFDLPLFAETAELRNVRTRWSTVCAPREVGSDFHVHFDGEVRDKRINCRVFYAYGSSRARPDEREPYAESTMNWLGQFFKDATSDASVRASFEMPEGPWRGRFNLPFKVTMSGLHTEVSITGITMALPKNDSGAHEAFLKKEGGKLSTSVKLKRKVEFATFSLMDELAVFDDVTRLWIEKLEP